MVGEGDSKCHLCRQSPDVLEWKETLKYIGVNSHRGLAVNLHSDERCDHLSLPVVGAEPSSDKPIVGTEIVSLTEMYTKSLCACAHERQDKKVPLYRAEGYRVGD